VFQLRTGSTLAGRLISSGPEGDLVQLRSGDRVRLPAGMVVGRVGGLTPLGAEPAPEQRTRVHAVLGDGRKVSGRLVSRDAGTLRIEQDDGTVLEVREEELAKIAFAEERYRGPPDPGRGRYLHVPSAFPLGRSEFAVSASSAATSTVEVGLTRWLALSAGVSLPVAYGLPVGSASYVGDLTARAPLLPWLRVAGGVRAIADEGGASALLFGAVTLGTENAHLTLYAGPPAPDAGRLGRFDEVVGAVSGLWRVHRHAALVAETWLTPRSDRPEALAALAGRLVTRRYSLDLGWIQTTAGEGGPWVAFGWRKP
jgi:hypothetical protein